MSQKMLLYYKYETKILEWQYQIFQMDVLQNTNIEFGKFSKENIFGGVGYDDDNHNPILLRINEKLIHPKLKNLFKRVVLHELAHIITERHFPNSNHNDKFKQCCDFFEIEFFDKVILTEEEDKIING